jgi:hypothetical protein
MSKLMFTPSHSWAGAQRMRGMVSGLVAASLLFGQVANAEVCARPADKTAFDIAGLKSQLMVTALACDVREQYNAFVRRFQPELMKQEHALAAYFSRSFGRHGQQEHDDYITSLANAQSEAGIKQGSDLCQGTVGLFDAVLALAPSATLAAFASDRVFEQPIALVVCPAPAPVTRTAQSQQRQ